MYTIYTIYIYVIYSWTMSTGREVSRKSAFTTSFDLSTVFKGILWIEQVYKIWCQFFCVTWFDLSVSFPNCNRKWKITTKKCSWQEFKHYLILSIYICIYVYIYIYIYVHIYIYIYIYGISNFIVCWKNFFKEQIFVLMIVLIWW